MRKSTILLTLAVLALGGWNVKLSRDLAHARAIAVNAALNMPEETDLSGLEDRLSELESRTDNLESVVSSSELEYHDLSDFEDRIQLLESRTLAPGFGSPLSGGGLLSP